VIVFGAGLPTPLPAMEKPVHKFKVKNLKPTFLRKTWA